MCVCVCAAYVGRQLSGPNRRRQVVKQSGVGDVDDSPVPLASGDSGGCPALGHNAAQPVLEEGGGQLLDRADLEALVGAAAVGEGLGDGQVVLDQ